MIISATTRVAFNTVQSPLGLLLAAQSERGLCGVFLGDDKQRLVQALQVSYPQAQETIENKRLNNNLDKLLAYIKNPKSPLDIVLDMQGTPFNQQVWSAVQAIPLGKTKSYSDIANAIDNPRAVRAVANACSANNLSLVIPCHRVVSKNGSITGYRWGIARKRALLEREQQATSA